MAGGPPIRWEDWASMLYFYFSVYIYLIISTKFIMAAFLLMQLRLIKSYLNAHFILYVMAGWHTPLLLVLGSYSLFFFPFVCSLTSQNTKCLKGGIVGQKVHF